MGTLKQLLHGQGTEHLQVIERDLSCNPNPNMKTLLHKFLTLERLQKSVNKYSNIAAWMRLHSPLDPRIRPCATCGTNPLEKNAASEKGIEEASQ